MSSAIIYGIAMTRILMVEHTNSASPAMSYAANSPTFLMLAIWKSALPELV